jgi:hypothetical protein
MSRNSLHCFWGWSCSKSIFWNWSLPNTNTSASHSAAVLVEKCRVLITVKSKSYFQVLVKSCRLMFWQYLCKITSFFRALLFSASKLYPTLLLWLCITYVPHKL